MAETRIKPFDSGEPRPGAGRLNQIVSPLNEIIARGQATRSGLDLDDIPRQVFDYKISELISDAPGYYKVKLYEGDADFVPGEKLADEKVGKLTEYAEGILFNLADIDAGKHLLGVGDRGVGRVKGHHTADGQSPYSAMIYIVADHRPKAPFIVRITKDGGEIGTKNTASSWTYTVKDETGSVTLGESVELYRARSAGKINYAPDGTYGAAAYIGGTLYLLDAYKESIGAVEQCTEGV